jgi:uncharacterized membrane protein SpoIIM required for sporulation
MKETDFIEQNKKKWARFEKLSATKNNDPDEVAELFTEITEDLSYAKTFYPRRSVRVYLNQLSQGVFTSLHKQKKQSLKGFGTFWKTTVPLEMYRARYNVLTAFVFFLLAVLVGIASQQYDNDFATLILGESYINYTQEMIEKGNPMGIYGDSPSNSMFFQITVNNIRVAFFAFATGIFWTLGSYFILLKNGIMLGAFQWWFYGKGLLLTSFLAVWIHGAFEISAIIIAGAAGITMGSGLIFPKSFPRVQSLIFSAKRGLVILLSLVPVLTIAGLLESYVTRHYLSMNSWEKWTIILLSFTAIVLYYVVYPFIVAKKYPDKIALKEIPRFIPQRKINWYEIRNAGKVFTDTFNVFIDQIRPISRLINTLVFPTALLILAIILSTEWSSFNSFLSWHQLIGRLFGTGIHFGVFKLLAWPIVLTLLLSSIFFTINQTNATDQLYRHFLRFLKKNGLSFYIFMLLFFTLMIFADWWMYIILFFIGPFLMLIPSYIGIEGQHFFKAVGNAFNKGVTVYTESLLSLLSFLVLSYLFIFLLDNPIAGLFDIVNELLSNLFITFTDYYMLIINSVDILFYLVYYIFIFTLIFIAIALLYYSLIEKSTAKGLYEKLMKFGKRSKSIESTVDFE